MARNRVLSHGSKLMVTGLALALALCLATEQPASAVAKTRVRKPGPLRVLLIGDSLTGNYGPVAASLLRAKGYQVTVAGRGGSGLLDSDTCKGKYARRQLRAVQPDIVVYQSKGNYNLLKIIGILPCKPEVKYGTPAFYDQWEVAARKTQKILSKWGARFIWLLNPSVSVTVDPGRQIVPRLNARYSRLAPSGGFVDAWTPFGGATYDPTLHHFDGLHLNAAGSQLMANLVVAKIG